MRLIDQVVQSEGPTQIVGADGRLWALPGAASLAGAVAAAPVRYVIGGDVCDACHEIIERWPELLDPCSDSLRVPVGAMWIEWIEADGRGGRRHAGMLVRVEESGRAGTIHGFWEEGQGGAERAQAHLRFDLDRVLRPAQDLHPPACPALRLLAPNALIVVEPEWLSYFAADAPGLIAAAVRRCAAQMVPNLPFLLALVRLIGVRANVAEAKVDRSALNRARARRGRPALLDHVEVSLSVGAERTGGHGGIGHRAPCRQHVVRGHLVNRQGRIFWRTTHLRGHAGAGGPIKRNIRLSMAPGFRPRPAYWGELEAAE